MDGVGAGLLQGSHAVVVGGQETRHLSHGEPRPGPQHMGLQVETAQRRAQIVGRA